MLRAKTSKDSLKLKEERHNAEMEVKELRSEGIGKE